MRITQKALTFDDVLLVPAYSNVLPRDVSLRTQLTRNIILNIPIVSAAMDTVTEARLAIALAQEGGIATLLRPYTQSLLDRLDRHRTWLWHVCPPSHSPITLHGRKARCHRGHSTVT